MQKAQNRLSRVLDRIGLLQTRLASLPNEERKQTDILLDLQITKDIIELIDIYPKVSVSEQIYLKRITAVLKMLYAKKIRSVDKSSLYLAL